LATGRSFRAASETPLLLRNDGSGWEAVSLAAAPRQTLIMGTVFSAPMVAWAFGFLGDQETPVLLRSDDAGLSWADVSSELPTSCKAIYDLTFADQDVGYLVSRGIYTSRMVFSTRDGGRTWQPIDAFPFGALPTVYAVAARGGAAELLLQDGVNLGATVVRLDDLSAPAIVLDPLATFLGANAFSTVGARGWIVTNLSVSASSPAMAAVFGSAAPGEPWLRQSVEHETFELRAIDVRDPQNGVAGGRGITPGATGLSPLALVTSEDGTSWQLAPITGVASDAIVVDVLRMRGNGGWAITGDETGIESAFLRSDDGGRSWYREATSFEHGVRLTDLARNTAPR
jgi:hypothetical protein